MKIVKTFVKGDSVYEMDIVRLLRAEEVISKFDPVIRLSISLKDCPPEMLFSMNITFKEAVDICDAIMFMVK